MCFGFASRGVWLGGRDYKFRAAGSPEYLICNWFKGLGCSIASSQEPYTALKP